MALAQLSDRPHDRQGKSRGGFVPAAVAAVLARAGSAPAAANPSVVVSHAAHSDVSPPLRKLHPLPATRGPSDERVIRKRVNPPFSGGPALTADPVQQLASPSAGAPSTLTSWDGVPNVDGFYPPDTVGDVG